MKLKRIVFFLLVLLFRTTLTTAVGKFDHEILGNITMLNSSIVPVSSENNRWSMGFGGGVGYSCHFTSTVSLRTGVHASYYRSTTGLSGGITEQSPPMDFPEELGWWEPTKQHSGNDLVVTTELDQYVAQQSALYIQVPVLAEFDGMFPNVGYLGWYAAGGVKAGYAITGNSDANIQGLTTRAKLLFENVSGVDVPTDLGFGVTTSETVRSKLSLGFQAIGYFEAGLKQQLTDRYTLYAGFFGEYCLYSVVGSTSTNMVDYKLLPVNPQQIDAGAKGYQLRYNPSANISGSSVQTRYPLSYGITVRIGFAFSKKISLRNDRLFNVRYFQY